jgi:hypothetical protein
MAIKQVEMAVRDPANAQRFVTEMTEVQTVRVNVRNADSYYRRGRSLSDVISGAVHFRPGEVKTLEISEALATKIRRHEEPPWQLTSDPPTPPAPIEDEVQP